MGNERQYDFDEHIDGRKRFLQQKQQEKHTDAKHHVEMKEESISEPVIISKLPDGIEENKNRWSGILKEVLFYIVFAILCIFIVPQYVIQRTEVIGPSMEETLHDEDQLLVNKLVYRFRDPKRFDIVVFKPPESALIATNKLGSKEYYVKRIIGLPGETIQIVGESIYINGEVLEEEYGKDPITYAGIASNEITLGEKEYFVLGDNRAVSYDSRYQEVGIIERDTLVGTAVFRLWPFNKFGIL